MQKIVYHAFRFHFHGHQGAVSLQHHIQPLIKGAPFLIWNDLRIPLTVGKPHVYMRNATVCCIVGEGYSNRKLIVWAESEPRLAAIEVLRFEYSGNNHSEPTMDELFRAPAEKIVYATTNGGH